MKIPAALARCCAGLLALLVAAGCATSGPRSRYLEQIAPGSIANLTAYRAGHSLEIIYPLGGKAAFAHATWNPAASGAAGYQCPVAIHPFEKEKRAARKAVVNQGHQLLI